MATKRWEGTCLRPWGHTKFSVKGVSGGRARHRPRREACGWPARAHRCPRGRDGAKATQRPIAACREDTGHAWGARRVGRGRAKVRWPAQGCYRVPAKPQAADSDGCPGQPWTPGRGQRPYGAPALRAAGGCQAALEGRGWDEASHGCRLKKRGRRASDSLGESANGAKPPQVCPITHLKGVG